MPKLLKPDVEPEWKAELVEMNPEVLFAEGFDDAYVGWVENRWVEADDGPIAVYAASKCVRILMDRDGMSYEQATEFFDFNVSGAYAGPNTPMFLMDRLDDSLDDETEAA